MKKTVKTLLLLCLTAVLAFGGTACGSSNRSDEYGSLKIEIVKYGYGTDWLKAMEKPFEEATGIAVDISEKVGDSGENAFKSEIESKTSDTDLFFTKRGWFAKSVYEGQITSKGKKYDCLYADLSDVWSSKASSSETKTIAEKMDATYAKAFKINGKYYALPWAGGVLGIVRNLNVWNSLKLADTDVPYTTNQLFALCDKVVSKGQSPFIYSLESEYYSGWSSIFFAQYEGRENADKFMSGLNPDGEMDENLYTYDGQLEAMKVLNTLINTQGYQSSLSTSTDFTTMQGHFINGQALFSINGSWLENEAANFADAELDVIKTPVLSSIVNKLSFCPTNADGKKIKADNFTAEQKATADAKLVEVIKYVDAVDAGETAAKPEGVTDEDIQIVTEARHYSYMAGGTDHYAYVPSYSKHIAEAKEFLKFMYSDEGLNIYYKTLKGATLPATPETGYTSDVALSTFRKSVNQATSEGFIFDRVETSRYFSILNISACFTNGVSPVVALRSGKTPAEIIATNRTEVKKKWDIGAEQVKG